VWTPKETNSRQAPAQELAMMEGYWGHGWGGMGFGGLLMLIVWVALIGAAVWLVRWLMAAKTARRRSPPHHTALDTLKERYAKGEIDRDEYEEKRRDLEA